MVPAALDARPFHELAACLPPGVELDPRRVCWLRGSATTFTELCCVTVDRSLSPLREGKLLHNRLVGSSSPPGPTI
jgi:hypothetical protein